MNIPIIPDSTYEGNEQFIVEFSNIPDSARRVGVGDISQACITIDDSNDGQFIAYVLNRLIVVTMSYYLLLT